MNMTFPSRFPRSHCVRERATMNMKTETKTKKGIIQSIKKDHLELKFATLLIKIGIHFLVLLAV